VTSTFFVILGSIVGVVTTLLMLVFIAACAPNSSPEQAAQLKTLALIVVVAGGVGVVGGIVCLVTGQASLALALGLAPVLVAIVVIALLFQIE
jgi:hypothetical protein